MTFGTKKHRFFSLGESYSKPFKCISVFILVKLGNLKLMVIYFGYRDNEIFFWGGNI